MPNVFTNPHRSLLYRTSRIRKHLKKPRYDEELPDYLSRHAIDPRRGVLLVGGWYWHPRFALARANEHAMVMTSSRTSETVRVRFHGRYLLAGLRGGADDSVRPEVAKYQSGCERTEEQEAVIRCRKARLKWRDKDYRERKQEIERDEHRVREERAELQRALRTALGMSMSVGDSCRNEGLLRSKAAEERMYAELSRVTAMDPSTAPVIRRYVYDQLHP